MKNYLNTIILAIAIVVTAIILANGFKKRNQTNNIISVTGMGKKDFTSDLIVWNGSFYRKSEKLKEAYAQLDKDKESIKTYLLGKGIKEKEIIFSAIDIQEENEDIKDEEGNKIKSVFLGYKLTQKVQIKSNEVDKIEEVSRNITELINTGVEFYSNPPDYYYTKLAELKVEMIAEATKDANLRAKKIAENAGGSLGSLKNAKMGVFQIVAQNSSEEYSWDEAFNTASKLKTAIITIKLDYEAD